MRKRSKSSPATPDSGVNASSVSGADNEPQSNGNSEKPKRPSYVILALFVLIIQGSWSVHHYQFEILPDPLTAEQAGKRGFSEVEAMKHVKGLTELGPHPVGSDALDHALQYVLTACESIKKSAHWEVDVEVDFFHVSSGANIMVGGLFKGKTLVYSDLNHIVLRILPKYAPEAEENAILVSSHIDSVFAAEGAGDCSSCVAVMLELARGISQWAHGFKNAVIFLFNTGEEEGLNGAHSFITQHPWSSTIRMAIDLEAMGVGGASSIFQAGPHPWAIENFAMVAKYPSGQILAQDLFSSGAIKSATDFQVYKEVAGLSGLDFAYADNTAVYHTKNDKLKLLKSGSLQHLGENMLAFLLKVGASSPHLFKDEAVDGAFKSGLDTAIYFDILGAYMIVYRQRFANLLHNSVILQSLLIWGTSVVIGGYPAAISLALSCLSVLLMWICSLSFSISVAFLLPLISTSPVPFISSQWLVVGLFVCPALLGALAGQHLGFLILKAYLSRIISTRNANLSPVLKADLIELDAERWLYKAGLLMWLVLLMIGNFYKIGSSFMALVWLVSPAFSYGLLEATLSPARLPKPLKTLTLLLGLSVPFLISVGMFVRLAATIIGTAVRFERNPGDGPEWLVSVILAVYIATVICLTLVYLLSYVHISGAKSTIFLATCVVFGLSVAAISSGIVPPFTEDIARTVNVVHVVDTTGRYEGQEASSYISLFSSTPGKLTKEVENIGEGFVCGRDKIVDFVTFSVHYGCWTQHGTESGWSNSDIPTLHVENDMQEDDRITEVIIDTKLSARWTLAINTNEIDDFRLRESSEELITLGSKSNVNGWHTIQFSGGKNTPTKFNLTLLWGQKYSKVEDQQSRDQHLLKLRTDVDRLTPITERIISKLPPWCSPFGKSTSPFNLAFLTSLPVDF